MPHRSAFEVELADATIRALDLIGFVVGYGHEFTGDFKPRRSFTGVDDLLMELHGFTSTGMEHFRKGRTVVMCDELQKMILTIEAAQGQFDLDVYDAAIDKLAYNARRDDHQLVNRQAAGGKSF